MDKMEVDGTVGRLSLVKNIILVLSGKGGVGKSTVAVQLAVSMKNLGFKVGLLDVDLCGPSIPTMLNIEDKSVFKSDDGWVPVFVDAEKRLSIMSVGFLLPSRNDPVIWKGPKKHAIIKQFLEEVCWPDMEFLIIDTPPGTSDEHISIVEILKQYNPSGAVVVTTPQAVATGDVRRELSFCKRANIPIIGIIENMSTFVCPNCQDCHNLFSKGGGQSLAEASQVPFLGCIPICPELSRCHDGQVKSLEMLLETSAKDAVNAIVQTVVAYCSKN